MNLNLDADIEKAKLALKELEDRKKAVDNNSEDLIIALQKAGFTLQQCGWEKCIDEEGNLACADIGFGELSCHLFDRDDNDHYRRVFKK